MSDKPVRYRALVGLSLPDGEKEVRVEAGELVPAKLVAVLPKEWLNRKVEVV